MSGPSGRARTTIPLDERVPYPLELVAAGGLANAPLDSGTPHRRLDRSAVASLQDSRHASHSGDAAICSTPPAACRRCVPERPQANSDEPTMPGIALPLRLLAAAVAYSRVHTGVHYPGDVIAESLIGSSIGEGVGLVARGIELDR